MTTRNLPSRSEAARHGSGDADLTVMLAAHAAFRRDLAQLAQAAAFADLPDPGRRASVQGHRADLRAIGDAADALASSLTAHLAHEERDGLPLIGEALSSAEWRRVGFKIVRRNGLSAGGEMFAWLADGADPDRAAAAIGTLPPPARLAYRAIWRPRYHRTSRW